MLVYFTENAFSTARYLSKQCQLEWSSCTLMLVTEVKIVGKRIVKNVINSKSAAAYDSLGNIKVLVCIPFWFLLNDCECTCVGVNKIKTADIVFCPALAVQCGHQL